MDAPLADATTQVVMEEVRIPKFSANSTSNSTQSQTAGHHIPQSGPQIQQGYPSNPNPLPPGGVNTPYPSNPTWVMPNQPYEPSMSNNTPYPPH